MEKQPAANYNNSSQNVPPLGAGTSTSSGVTVFDPSLPNSSNTPAPPSYDQAMGTAAPAPPPQTARTYMPNAGWNAGMGATQTTTTTFTTYGPSVQQQPPRNYQQPSFIQPPVVIVQRKLLNFKGFIRGVVLNKKKKTNRIYFLHLYCKQCVQ